MVVLRSKFGCKLLNIFAQARFHTYLAHCHKNLARLSKIFGGASNFELTGMPVLLVLKHVSLLEPTSGLEHVLLLKKLLGPGQRNSQAASGE